MKAGDCRRLNNPGSVSVALEEQRYAILLVCERGGRMVAAATIVTRVPARNSLTNCCFFATLVAGACFGATKTDVVCFSRERLLEPMAIPDSCVNGHLLTLILVHER